MRRFALVAALVLFAPAVRAQTRSIPLFANFDLDTPTVAATANRIVTAVDYADGELTLAAQPDTPRNLTATLTDGNSSCSGTFAIVGTDVDGNVLTDSPTAAQLRATWTGTKVYATVTSITISSAAGCGAGADTVVVGVGSTVAPIYCVLGAPVTVSQRIKTTGSSATVAEVDAAVDPPPFTNVAVGDQITVQESTVTRVRYVATRASASQITVKAGGNADFGQPQEVAAVDWSATAGYPFSYRHHNCGYGSSAGWINVGSATSSSIFYTIDQSTATGGVTYSVQCRQPTAARTPIEIATATDTDTAWPAATGVVVPTAVCEAVRVGLKFGTNDDGSDAGVEAISVSLVLR